MIFFFSNINDEFERVNKLATALRLKFESDNKPNELLADGKNLASKCHHLLSLLPAEIRDEAKLKRHIAWMEKWLKDGKIYNCKRDIEDICERDLDELELLFKEWLKKGEYYDKELNRSVGKLMDELEFDSAIRKSFILLTERLRKKFKVKWGQTKK